MLHRIYTEINSADGFMYDLIAEKIYSETGLNVTPARIRKVIEIKGDITKEAVSALKQAVASERNESVSVERDKKAQQKNGRILIMQKYGRTDRKSEEIADMLGLLLPNAEVLVTVGTEITLPDGTASEDAERIKRALINEYTHTSTPGEESFAESPKVDASELIAGFNSAKYAELEGLKKQLGLDMDMDDMVRVQNYFLSESREPTLTELRIADRFFSESFRHTTLRTVLSQVECKDEAARLAWEHYRSLRKGGSATIFDIATAANSYVDVKGIKKATEKLNGISVDGECDGKELLMLVKNENCNRSVTASPYDGAANCLGGSVRDLLCALAYPFESCRLYGYSDSAEELEKATEAARGYSDYARGLGIPCSENAEAVSDGYVKKQFEFCLALALTDSERVGELLKRRSESGDTVFLLGGKTGRDGAALMSAADKKGDPELVGEYVPVGKAGILAAMQRLFNDESFARCCSAVNDVGSGGIICAISEIASGATVRCDAVPLKYEGLGVDEILLSESQERMVVAVSPQNVAEFSELCARYGVPCAAIATVNDTDRFTISDEATGYTASLTRGFLMSEGFEKKLGAVIEKQSPLPESKLLKVAREPVDKVRKFIFSHSKKNFLGAMELAARVADRKLPRIRECVDETCGGGAVFSRNSAKRPEASVRELSYNGKGVTKDGKRLCSVVGSGITCEISSLSPYKSAYLSVTEAVMKLVASGYGDRERYIAIQEYFPRHESSSKRLGVSVSSMLGVFEAQMNLKTASIAGRGCIAKNHPDSPEESTVAVFAVCVGESENAITRDLKRAGSRLVLIKPEIDHVSQLPTAEGQNKVIDTVNALIASGSVLSASVVNADCVASEMIEMCRAAGMGVAVEKECTLDSLFDYFYGSALLEIAEGVEIPKGATVIGTVTEQPSITYLGDEFPITTEKKAADGAVKTDEDDFIFLKTHGSKYGTVKTVSGGKPRVLIPVTNYSVPADDVRQAFKSVGATADVFTVNEASVERFAEELTKTDILYIPDGSVSSAFMSTVLSLPAVKNELRTLKKRGGLIYGNGNSFEALIKSGLIELDGKKIGFSDNSDLPIAYGFSEIAATSTLSPFMRYASPTETFDTVTFGKKLRLTADPEYIKELKRDGRILMQYSRDPLGSVARIDALCSKDGRVMGQISHPERIGDGLTERGYRAFPFIRSAVGYFKKG